MGTRSKPPSSAKSGLEAQVQHYASARDRYEAFATRIRVLLSDVLANAKIDVHALESRSKTVDSVRAKLSKPGRRYENLFDEISDLAGVRVILYYSADAYRVANIVEQLFDVDRAQSGDKITGLREDQFGYLSLHYVVSLPRARRQMAEWSVFGRMTVEIQIRTVLQHAWAAISHKLSYKREPLIPSQYRRRLTRLAGLMELADQEFGALAEAQSNTNRAARLGILKTGLRLPVDLVTVTQYARVAPPVSAIANFAKRVGVTVLPHHDEAHDLTTVALALGLSSIGALQASLLAALPRTGQFVKLFFDGPDYSASPQFLAALVLLAANAETISKDQAMEVLDWNPAYLFDALAAGRHVFGRRAKANTA